MATFADDLRQAMKSAGITTQAALADLTGIRQSALCKYLSGANEPRLPYLEILEANLPKLRALRRERTRSNPKRIFRKGA